MQIYIEMSQDSIDSILISGLSLGLEKIQVKKTVDDILIFKKRGKILFEKIT